MKEILEEARAALWTVWNRKWLALAVAWGICLAGWLVVALIPNSYESEARIFVQLDDVLAEQIGLGAGSREKDLERVRQTLTSAVNLEKVVRSTRLGDTITTPAEMEKAVEDLGEDILITAEGENLFIIKAKSGQGDLSDAENAQLAQDIALKMIDIFREENLGGARGEMRSSIDFLDQQLAERQKQLEEAEQRRLAFESEHPELIGGASAISSRLSNTRAELRSAEADLAAATSSLAAIEGQIASTPRALQGQGGTSAALQQAEANVAGLRARGLTDSHPDMIAAERQVANLRQQQSSNGNAGMVPNPAYSALMSIRAERLASVQSLRSRVAALRAEIAQVSADQAMEPGVAAEAQRISRDYEVLREQYDKLLQDREELRLRGQVETERSAIKFEVVDPPSTPRVPAAPNRPLLLFGVLFVGLAAGAGTAWALGKVNSTFATANKLEDTFDLPVIGTISNNLTDAAKKLRAKRTKQFAGGAAALVAMFVVLVGLEFVQRGMIA
ncbi:XrtA system polysaccharide chain length determinant [Paraurantiacibacter namhicola]|uniref:Chain length determinant protein n=1 Tax=Paraurantiacibacter namhicola TaxID=645517 RepID=A0A1C7D9H4_9SPHN|nr:XrtA system polysaccharide chain length determinant [Paraurantiacibacter namhicola]ANU08139.1 Chain length determinant protein [Paraurantiacibacter namhicola]